MSYNKIGNAMSGTGAYPIFCREENRKTSFYLQKDQLTYEKIEDLDLPKNLELTSCISQQSIAFFNQCSLRLVPLTDDKYKLYVSLKLLGGGNFFRYLEDNPNASNTEICQWLITNNLPPDTFTSVYVHTGMHEFIEGWKMARTIKIKPHADAPFARFVYWCKVLLKGCPPVEGNAFNENRIQGYLTHPEALEDNERILAEQEIRRAFEQKQAIHFYVSFDGLSCYVDIPVSSGFCQIF